VKPELSAKQEPDVTPAAPPVLRATPSGPLAPHAIPPAVPRYVPLEQDVLPDVPQLVLPQDEPRPHCAPLAGLLHPDCRQQPRYAERSSAVPRPWSQDGHGWR
jgi:hypothetical protein